MGGHQINPPVPTPEEKPSMDQDYLNPSLPSQPFSFPSLKVEDGRVSQDNRLISGELDQVGPFSTSSLEIEANQRRRRNIYSEVLQSYDPLRVHSKILDEAKSKILSYVPGAWIDNVGSDYDVPKTTTLLLVGPKGCGKSSLINKISRIFEDDKFASERAQVSYKPFVGDGTYFLQEYMIPRGSTSFCLYDTRSLSDDKSENIDMITCWMTKGVRHGELIIRESDSSRLRSRMKCKTQEDNCLSTETRKVNFVIFVVHGVSFLKSMEGDDNEGKQYIQLITKVFNCPHLSFKDDKPVVVVTHGDLLSLSDRLRIRVHLGELLGISPAKQIFDIPESCDPITELTIVEMLRYSLEHADRNLPRKNWVLDQVHKVSVPACACLLINLGIALVSARMKHLNVDHARKPKSRRDRGTIWHKWLD
ncbi:uncharacterized protein LOC110429322 isoform X2 [Herrania umbratica]|uniref:Uncharacterized protein LOC110429322 isoform X2 n=1 Tax=Herrania umbratica TaxID=108875 RepID=A0A6J1BND8_9ROSI|nr:uncharacterized protein LOC110429322 isoform X2 [Herrania umbratica]